MKGPFAALKRRLPTREQILARPSLRHVRPWLDHPWLWHASRHTVPGGLAAGVAAGMLPPPLQTLCAVFLAFRLRLHLPSALLGTLLTNPFTILPIYWLAYAIGALLLGRPLLGFADLKLAAADDIGSLWPLLGWPWLLGTVVLAATLAVFVCLLCRVMWLVSIRWRWRKRARARLAAQSRKRRSQP